MGSWEARGVIRFFPPDRRVLNRLDLRVETGETVRILGRSGAGKTLLTQVLTGQAVPEEGQVFLEGEELSALSPERRLALRRRRLGILSREPGFFPRLSMEDNVSLALQLMGEGRRAARRKAREAMERFGVLSGAGRLPGQLTPGGGLPDAAGPGLPGGTGVFSGGQLPLGASGKGGAGDLGAFEGPAGGNLRRAAPPDGRGRGLRPGGPDITA